MFKTIILFSLLYSFASPALAQQGPLVPCVGCDSLTQAPFPETGSWYNPDQSGTGINMKIQNGFLTAFYYGYTAEGLPEWRLINGPLVRSTQAGLLWELDTTMLYIQGGNCIGCDYQPPMSPSEGPAIRLEFLQRNYLSITIGDSPSQFYVPIIFGSAGMQYFEEQTPYVFPKYGYETYFMMVTKPNTDPPSPWLWESFIMPIGPGIFSSDESKLVYKTWIPTPPPGPDVLADLIVCELDQVSNEPGCKWVWGSKEYVIPIANMSDSRIFGEAEDGSTIEGYRLSYD